MGARHLPPHSPLSPHAAPVRRPTTGPTTTRCVPPFNPYSPPRAAPTQRRTAGPATTCCVPPLNPYSPPHAAPAQRRMESSHQSSCSRSSRSCRYLSCHADCCQSRARSESRSSLSRMQSARSAHPDVYAMLSRCPHSALAVLSPCLQNAPYSAWAGAWAVFAYALTMLAWCSGGVCLCFDYACMVVGQCCLLDAWVTLGPAYGCLQLAILSRPTACCYLPMNDVMAALCRGEKQQLRTLLKSDSVLVADRAGHHEHMVHSDHAATQCMWTMLTELATTEIRSMPTVPPSLPCRIHAVHADYA
eukprot:366042-Chlamydomonas_euryale.AAC.4